MLHQAERIKALFELVGAAQQRIIPATEANDWMAYEQIKRDVKAARDGLYAEREDITDETAVAFLLAGINAFAMLTQTIDVCDQMMAAFATGERIAATHLAGGGAKA